jgi:hypothetical protein
LRFLATSRPAKDFPSIESVEARAIADKTDVATAKANAVDAMHKCVLSSRKSGTGYLWKALDMVFLMQWLNIWVEMSAKMMDLLGATGEGEEEPAKKWADLLDRYNRRITSQAAKGAEGIPYDSKDPIDRLKLTMANKLGWIHSGSYSEPYHPIVQQLPIPNKFIFNQIQRLFDDDKGFSLREALMEVSTDRKCVFK